MRHRTRANQNPSPPARNCRTWVWISSVAAGMVRLCNLEAWGSWLSFRKTSGNHREPVDTYPLAPSDGLFQSMAFHKTFEGRTWFPHELICKFTSGDSPWACQGAVMSTLTHYLHCFPSFLPHFLLLSLRLLLQNKTFQLTFSYSSGFCGNWVKTTWIMHLKVMQWKERSKNKSHYSWYWWKISIHISEVQFTYQESFQPLHMERAPPVSRRIRKPFHLQTSTFLRFRMITVCGNPNRVFLQGIEFVSLTKFFPDPLIFWVSTSIYWKVSKEMTREYPKTALEQLYYHTTCITFLSLNSPIR